MRCLVAIALGLSLTGQAFAQDQSSNLESSFYSANQNSQIINTFGGGTSSQSTFRRDMVVCDSPKLTFGVIPTWNDKGMNGYSAGDGVTAGISVTIPFGSTISRCKQLQRTIIRTADLKQVADTMQHDYNTIMMCAELRTKGIIVEADQFAFAQRCESVTVSKVATNFVPSTE